MIQSDSIYFSNWRCKKRAISESWFFSWTWKVIYIHDKIFWAAISRIQITVVIERIVWHINGKVIATTSYRNRSESFLKSAYHGVGNFCNLLAIIKRLNLFDFKVICLMLVCKGFIVRGFHWQHVVRYHVKMDKLLQKEAKVTKVPDDTYGEREREREEGDTSVNFYRVCTTGPSTYSVTNYRHNRIHFWTYVIFLIPTVSHSMVITGYVSTL